jgi:UDP-glucose 4-epimerase
VKILMIAGVGYIESTLVPLLLSSGNQVRVLDTLEHWFLRTKLDNPVDPDPSLLRCEIIRTVKAGVEEVDRLVQDNAIQDFDSSEHRN